MRRELRIAQGRARECEKKLMRVKEKERKREEREIPQFRIVDNKEEMYSDGCSIDRLVFIVH